MANRSTYVAPAHTIALILAGGRGSRLYELTDRRSKPAVHFGGNYRLIDFALSNCVNSGIRRIAVATQYKSHSLLRHINQAWSFLQPTVNEFVDLLPAQQRVDENSWYRGTADAVYQNIDILQSYRPFPKYVVILAGDHIYKMNYSVMLSEHIASGAECTVACIEVPRNDAKGFGVMAVDKTGKIIRFVEKPADPPPMPGNPDKSLCSMGIYIFNADYLFDALVRDMHKENTSHDFGKDIIPEAVAKGVAMSHAFSGSCVHGVGEPDNQEDYWRDVGTIDSFWEANIDLTHTVPKLNLYDSAWPIWTAQPQRRALPQHHRFGMSDSFARQGALDGFGSARCGRTGSVPQSVHRRLGCCHSERHGHRRRCQRGRTALPALSDGYYARDTRHDDGFGK